MEAAGTPAARGRGRPRGPGVDAARRREELLDAAEEAVEAAGADFSVADVAKAAGYARSAVYAAFEGRPAILAALGERHAAVLLAGMYAAGTPAAAPSVRFEAALDVLFGWAQRRPGLYRVLMPAGLFERLAAEIEALLRAAGTAPDTAAPGARAMLGSVTAAIDWWLRSDAAMPRERLVGYLAGLAWGGGVGLPDGWMAGD